MERRRQEANESGNATSGDEYDETGYPIDLDQLLPEAFALPLYGYAMPLIVAVTIVTNSFIVIVLSQKHLRTPTNFVLAAMAVTELLTGLCSMPFFVYYFTLNGYQLERLRGLPPFWCATYGWFSEILPAMFHTSALWLTVFLAVQRYVYVCVPQTIHRHCTPAKTRFYILTICLAALLCHMPEMAVKTFRLEPSAGSSELGGRRRRRCLAVYAHWLLRSLGRQRYDVAYLWLRILAFQLLPCVLLVVFTAKLICTIRGAELRKKSWTSTAGLQTNSNNYSTASIRAVSTASRRCSIVARAGRSMYATNKMLAVVICLFLAVELPAALIFTVHFVNNQFLGGVLPEEAYHYINSWIIVRNVLISVTYPIKLGIYCSMSEQFRLTVRQLFSRHLLFVTQAQITYHGGKRYSLILVDVSRLEKNKRAFNMQEQASAEPAAYRRSLKTNSAARLDCKDNNAAKVSLARGCSSSRVERRRSPQSRQAVKWSIGSRLSDERQKVRAKQSSENHVYMV